MQLANGKATERSLSSADEVNSCRSISSSLSRRWSSSPTGAHQNFFSGSYATHKIWLNNNIPLHGSLSRTSLNGVLDQASSNSNSQAQSVSSSPHAMQVNAKLPWNIPQERFYKTLSRKASNAVLKFQARVSSMRRAASMVDLRRKAKDECALSDKQ